MKISGNKPYIISYLKYVLEENIPALQETIKLRIKRAIRERLAIDPINLGEPLRYGLKGQRRLRVGDYRVIYRVDIEKHKVVIVLIGHRKDIYKQTQR